VLAQLHSPALQLLKGQLADQAARLAPDTPGPHLLHLRDQWYGSVFIAEKRPYWIALLPYAMILEINCIGHG
jgi:hypothetical protein